MTFLPEKKKNGFTLIEIILSLVVIAILGAMYAQFFGTAFQQSSIPIQSIRDSFELQQVMEKITTDYENDPTDLTSQVAPFGLQGKINANNYGHIRWWSRINL